MTTIDCSHVHGRISTLHSDMIQLIGLIRSSKPMHTKATNINPMPVCLGYETARNQARGFLVSQEKLGASVVLNNGVTMPRLSYGTAHRGSPARLFRDAVIDGFRHFDLAQGYGMIEQSFGHFLRDKAGTLKKLKLTRSDLFVTSKLTMMTDYSPAARTRTAVLEMLNRTESTWLDLLLLHSWHAEWSKVLSAWKTMEALVDEGKVKAIGLSNVEVPHLKWLLPRIRIKPAVVQNIANVVFPGHDLADQPDIFTYCRERNIVVQAYSPLGTSEHHILPMYKDAHVRYIAQQVGRSPGEVVLNWAMRMGGAAATQSLNSLRRKQSLQAHTVPLAATHLAELNRMAALWHCQGQCALPGLSFTNFSCGSKDRLKQPHVILRFECITPAYRLLPLKGTIGPPQFYNRSEI